MNNSQEAVIHAYKQIRSEPMPAAGTGQVQLTSTAAPGVHLTIYQELHPVEALWRRFEQAAECAVFQSFDYLAAWQKHIGARNNIVPIVVVARTVNGSILFLLPLALERSSFVRRLTWLGQDTSAYLAPLLSNDFSRMITPLQFTGVWREICALMQSRPCLRYDVIEFQKMPEMVGSLSNPFLHLRVTPNPSGAHLMRLQGDWESFYKSKRSSATRRHDRAKIKHLARHGEIQMITPVGESEITRTFETLIHQKSEWLKRIGAADIFLQAGFKEFYHDLAINSSTQNIAHISRLEIGSTMAAVNFGLQYHGRYYLVLSSYDQGKLSRFGPGIVHLRELMRRAIEMGLREFDFMIGDHSYKFEWAEIETRLYDHYAAASLRGLPAAMVAGANARLKRTVKRTPMLWNSFSRARAVKAAVLAYRRKN